LQTTTAAGHYRACVDGLRQVAGDTFADLYYELVRPAFDENLGASYWDRHREVVQRFLAELDGPCSSPDRRARQW
jgi:hypothetical protein